METKNPHQESFLPDFCSVQVLLFLVLSVELAILAMTLVSNGLVGDFWLQLGLLSFYSQWLLLSMVALLCALRNSYRHRLGVLGQSLMVLIFATLLSLLLSMAILETIPITQNHLGFMLRNSAVVIIFTGLLLRHLYAHYQQRQQAALAARAQFQALQARIRPHFLFNSMNTLASLARSQPTRVEDTVLNLAELFRAALAKEDQLSSLGEEIALARQYLEIEALRLAERLEVDWTLEENLPLSMPLPHLTLQPLLENAVYHGIEPLTQGGKLQIKGWRQKDRLFLELNNPLPVQPSGKGKGFGIAMENVRARLQSLFGDQALLELERTDDLCRVRLELPCTS